MRYLKTTMAVLALSTLLLGLIGCSGDSSVDPAAGNSHSQAEILKGTITLNEGDIELVTPSGVQDGGQFSLYGRNIHYDTEAGALVIDFSVVNHNEEPLPEPVTLTFLSLAPDTVTVLNPSNDVTGAGAAIVFEFDNDDGQWTTDEESLPRMTQFGVAEGTSIAFIARLEVGSDNVMGSIGGMVWHDLNGDGIMDEGETGIEGAEVMLEAEDMAPMMALTDADGYYQFDGLDVGLYLVTKMPVEGMMMTTPGELNVILAETEEGVSSFLAAHFGCMSDSGLGSIGGMVWHDLNGDGIMDEDEAGFEGAEVMLEAEGMEPVTAMTDTNGYYQFDGLDAGLYHVSKVPLDGEQLTTPGEIEVILVETDEGVSSYLEAHFGCMPFFPVEPGSISGMVFEDLNENRMYDDGEPGIAGVRIHLKAYGIDCDDMTILTDEEGYYLFEDLEEARYRVKKLQADGWRPSGLSLKWVELAGGEHREGVDFGVLPTGNEGDDDDDDDEDDDDEDDDDEDEDDDD